MLGDAAYSAAARHIADEIAALPSPEVAIGLLERLAREHHREIAGT